MIDFIKLNIQNPDIQAIRVNQCLKWDQLASEETGEIKEHTAKYGGMTVRVTNGKYLEVAGSLHKHWNLNSGAELHNYNDFTFPDLVQTVNDLCKNLSLNPASCKIDNMEYGVNVATPIPVNRILKAAILHRLKPFSTEYAETKYYRECEHQRYIVKLYNKGLQFTRTEHILRFELKVLKMEQLKRFRIANLTDILNHEILARLGKELTDNFTEILFTVIEPYTGRIKDREKNTISEGRAAQYWTDLNDTNPNTYKKRRGRFIKLVREHTTFDIPGEIAPMIGKKWAELLKAEPKTLPYLTGSKTLPYLTGDNTLVNPLDKGLTGVQSITGVPAEFRKAISSRIIKTEHEVPIRLITSGMIIAYLSLTTGRRIPSEMK